jgi:hypothetical protein
MMINWISSTIKIAAIYALILQTVFVPGRSYAQSGLESQTQMTCANDPSTKWDANLNRCVTTASSVADREEYLKCTDTSRYETPEARKKCHDDYANKRANTDNSDVFEGVPWAGTALNVVLAAVSFINTTGKGQKPKGCTAKTIIKYTATANVLFELYFQFMAKKALTDLQENYEKAAVSEDPFQAQVDAFNFIKDEQDEIKKLAKLRFIQYAISTVGYGAALVLAGMALSDITGSQYAACTGSEPPPEDGAAGETPAETPAETLSETPAETPAETVTPGKATAEAAAGKPMAAFFNSLPTLIVLCGLMTMYNGWLASMAKKEEEKAEERKEALEKIIAKFEHSVAGYCPSGRDEMNEPRCYCYKDGGGKNMDRSNSETCQALWAQDSQNYFVAASDYSKNKTKNPVGCMTTDGEFDQKCKCKKFKDPQGQNACFKVVPISNINIPGLAGTTNDLGKTVNSLTNGALSPADVNAGKLGKSAKSLSKLRSKLLSAINKKRARRGIKPIKLASPATALKFAKKITNKAAVAAAGKKNLGNLSSAGSSTNPALQKAVREAKKMSGLSFGGGKGLNNRRKKKKGGFKLDFGNGGRSGGKGNVKTFMAKDYNYKDNDIVDRDDVSIFQVISNRYNVSGLKRLFDEDEEQIPVQ